MADERGHDRDKKKGPHEFPFDRSFKILGYIFNPSKRKQSMVERREDLQKQECTVENKAQKNGGSSLLRIRFWERKLVLEPSDPGQNQRLGDKTYEVIIQSQKKE